MELYFYWNEEEQKRINKILTIKRILMGLGTVTMILEFAAFIIGRWFYPTEMIFGVIGFALMFISCGLSLTSIIVKP